MYLETRFEERLTPAGPPSYLHLNFSRWSTHRRPSYGNHYGPLVSFPRTMRRAAMRLSFGTSLDPTTISSRRASPPPSSFQLSRAQRPRRRRYGIWPVTFFSAQANGVQPPKTHTPEKKGTSENQESNRPLNPAKPCNRAREPSCTPCLSCPSLSLPAQ